MSDDIDRIRSLFQGVEDGKTNSDEACQELAEHILELMHAAGPEWVADAFARALIMDADATDDEAAGDAGEVSPDEAASLRVEADTKREAARSAFEIANDLLP